jgi:hypothetical protein
MTPLLRHALPYLLVLATIGGWRACDVQRQRQIGAMRERLHAVDSSLVVARAAGRRIDSVLRTDTVKLRRIETRTITLLDTLLHSDTVVLTQRESVLVFVTDSLVRQCRVTVDECLALNANLVERLALTEQQRDAYRVLVPSPMQRTRTTIAAALIGAAVTYVLVRP